ncbi:MAG TPA: hypothetical protein VKT49_15965 [Bryobacteraceae bacterium]|nr:hypothetical protein [Bryobacteraceae bacterium]
MKYSIASLLIVAGLAIPQGKQTFTGVITDSMCATGDHSRMRMGDTDAQCTVACVEAHGATYVLYDGKATYELSDQKAPEKFAGKKVTVTGTLNAKAKTIQVESMAEAK